MTFMERLIEKFWALFGRRSPPPAVVLLPAEPVPAAPEIEEPAPAPEQVDEEIVEVKSKKPRKPNVGPIRRELTEHVSEFIEKVTAISSTNMVDVHDRRDHMDGLELLFGCDFHYLDDIRDKLSPGSKYLNESARELTGANWPIDTAVIMKRSDDSLSMMRVHTANPASLRGRARLVPQRCAWMTEAVITNDGSWWASSIPVGLIGEEWRCLMVGMDRVVTDNRNGPRYTGFNDSMESRKQIHDQVLVAQTIQLTERYHWHVALGSGSGPRILLPTNPAGCLDIFKTRSRSSGETRKEALRHWVSNHYRSTETEEELVYVRDHLRGATKFSWKDFECELFVSEFDLEKNELFKTQAAEWRAARKHNRVKIKLKKKVTP